MEIIDFGFTPIEVNIFIVLLLRFAFTPIRVKFSEPTQNNLLIDK